MDLIAALRTFLRVAEIGSFSAVAEIFLKRADLPRDRRLGDPALPAQQLVDSADALQESTGRRRSKPNAGATRGSAKARLHRLPPGEVIARAAAKRSSSRHRPRRCPRGARATCDALPSATSSALCAGSPRTAGIRAVTCARYHLVLVR